LERALTSSAPTSPSSRCSSRRCRTGGHPKPTVKTINIDIKDPSTVPTTVDAFFQKGYDIIGYGGDSGQIPLANILAVKANSNEKADLLTQPKGRTTWVSFSIGYPTGGPFQGESAAAKGLRLAFDLAVDKNGLATTVCHDLTCTAATGGLITSGLIGNGGPNSDPLAKFDKAKAKSLLAQYDPTGSLTKNLTYSYNAGSPNDQVATYLQNEWQTNLGVHVNLNAVSDASIFISKPAVGQVPDGPVMVGSSTTTIRRTGTTTSGVCTHRQQAPTPAASTTRRTTPS